MLKSFLKLFRSDCRIIANYAMILSVISGPLLVIVFMKFLFPAFSDFIYSKTGFPINKYYSLIAITFVCLVPFLPGILYANIIKDKRDFQSEGLLTVQDANRNFLFMRMLIAALICFILLWLTIILVKPVPAEGWLRNLFIACLLSVQAPLVCLLICTLVMHKVKRISVFVLCCIFLITVPFGLLVHHPWNYFAFFSPLYWVAWSWVIRSPMESLLYGTIAVILTSGVIVLLFRNYNMTRRQ
jgi:hypothetical protein